MLCYNFPASPTLSSMRKTLLGLAVLPLSLLSALPTPVLAASPPAQTEAQRIAALEAKVQALEAELQAMKSAPADRRRSPAVARAGRPGPERFSRIRSRFARRQPGGNRSRQQQRPGVRGRASG